MRQLALLPGSAAHLLAACIALFYSWHVSQSAFFKTGAQFVGPLLIIMLVHMIWLLLTGRLVPGFANVIYKRSALTAVGMAVTIVFASIVAPQPARAAGSDGAAIVLGVLFCVAMIAIVAGVLALILIVVVRLIEAMFRRIWPNDRNGPESRLFDAGSMAIVALFLGVSSLEGIPQAYHFAAAKRAEATIFIDAAPDVVWQTLSQATSPDFPLPEILSVFPQPVAVVMDEGTSLGAIRKVKFQGREGAGFLTLQVTERTQTRAVFDVVSDTTPYARWVAYQRLTYQTQPEGTGTRLTVALQYDRLLAPAWFFAPMTKGAAHLAMDVLARDVRHRAEQ